MAAMSDRMRPSSREATGSSYRRTPWLANTPGRRRPASVGLNGREARREVDLDGSRHDRRPQVQNQGTGALPRDP